MGLFRRRLLRLLTLNIATTVLLNVKDSYSQDSQCCAWHGCTEDTSTVTSESTLTPKYLELNRGTTLTPTLICGEHYNSDEVLLCKVKRCGDRTETKKMNASGMLLHRRNQGLYFCSTESEGDCRNSINSAKPVVVTIQGEDTYLISFELQVPKGSNWFAICGEGYMNTSGRYLTRALCEQVQSDDNNKCGFYPRYLVSGSNGHYSAGGYLYRIAQSEPVSLPCQARCDMQVNITNITSPRPVSFCKSVGPGTGEGVTVPFPKTKIGMTANSTEMLDCKPCPSVPKFSMFCKGDFITPASWDDQVNNTCNCTCLRSNTSLHSLDTNGTMENATGSDGNPVANNTLTGHCLIPLNDTKETTENISGINPVIEVMGNDTPVTIENVNMISRMLSEETKNLESFDVEYMMWISERLKNISEAGSPSHNVTRNVMEIVDNLLSVKEDVYKDIISRGVPSMILRALETQLKSLHEGGSTFRHVTSSVGALAVQLERSAFGEKLTFGGIFSIEGMNDSDVNVTEGKENSSIKYPTTITLPVNLLDNINIEHNKTIPVTFIIHRTSLLFISNSSQQRQQRESIESLVIAATVEGQNISNLSSPVISRFQLPRIEENMTTHSRKCVFWDFNLSGGLGDWSSEGCELVSGSRNKTDLVVECHCNHLTNFAVLLDVQGDIDHVVLDILSIIGCVVSIFALIITLIVLLAVKKLREQIPQQIIINLCLALLGLYICFLTGIDKSSLGTVCVIFGALIHYFCLASVAWMCIVAINMYLLFVRVFNADVAGFTWKACIVAWGLPMVVVIVSVILTHQNYTGSYCFPQTGTLTFYLGVLLLIALMLGFNLIIFILIIRQVTCGRIGKPAGQDKRTEMFERAQSIIIISVLLGLTWVFGFLSIGGARFIFNLLFLIFNSLQGFFIFVFFVLRPKNVRMILFKRCYRRKQSNVGRYTVNKTKTEENIDQKDTLDLGAIVVTSSN